MKNLKEALAKASKKNESPEFAQTIRDFMSEHIQDLQAFHELLILCKEWLEADIENDKDTEMYPPHVRSRLFSAQRHLQQAAQSVHDTERT